MTVPAGTESAAGAAGAAGSGAQGAAGESGSAGAGGTGSGSGGRAAPWTEANFDADRAARLLESTTADRVAAVKRAEAAESKLREREQAELSEVDRLKAQGAEKDAKLTAAESQSLRLSIMLENAPDTMTAKRAAQLAKRLTGSTPDELKADAIALIEEFGEGGEAGKGKGGKPGGGAPKERLRGGANNDDDEGDDGEFDVDKIPRY